MIYIITTLVCICFTICRKNNYERDANAKKRSCVKEINSKIEDKRFCSESKQQQLPNKDRIQDFHV